MAQTGLGMIAGLRRLSDAGLRREQAEPALGDPSRRRRRGGDKGERRGAGLAKHPESAVYENNGRLAVSRLSVRKSYANGYARETSRPAAVPGTHSQTTPSPSPSCM